VGQVLGGAHAVGGEREGDFVIHAFKREHVVGRNVVTELLFDRQRVVEQRIAGTGAKFLDDVLVEALDSQQLADRHVGDFLDRAETLGDQDAGDFLVDFELVLEQGARRRLLGLGLRGDLVLGHDVELPAREAAGEAHVLAALADGLGQAVLGDREVHRVLVLVDHDRLYFGRRHGVDHELRRVVRPQHDVDALAVELVGHRLHARTAHADAGTDRIGAGVVGDHGDLGAVARITRAGLDLDQALADFRHFELEQFDHELRRRTADEELRSARLGAHVVPVAADAVAGAHDVARDPLVPGDAGCGLATEAAGDVAALDALDHAGDQVAHAILPRIHDLLALGLAHALHAHLLGGLGRDAAEVDVLDLLFDVVADLDALGLVDRVHHADLAIRRLHHHVVGHDLPAAEGLV